MDYIIDGYNLIKSSFLTKVERNSAESAKTFLFRILVKYRKQHSENKFIIVFDGHPGSLGDFRERELSILFSGDETADDLILAMLEKKRKNENTVVVTDDREVRTGTRILGGMISSTTDFMNLVYPQPKPANIRPAAKELPMKEIISIERELKEFYEHKSIAQAPGKSRGRNPRPLRQG